MKPSLRALVFRYMLAVIGVTAVVRLAVWGAYQAYEARRGHVVFHEQLGEMLLLLLVEVLALLLLGFMLWGLSRRLLSPLRSVANAATLIARGHLHKRIRTRHLPEGELRTIAEALNESFDRYQEAIDRIARFSSAASHQLRTPLTAIRATAETALGPGSTPEEQAQALGGILEEAEHMSRMAEQLLLLSRMEAEYLRDDFTDVDLNEIVRKVFDLYQPLLEAGQLQVAFDLGESCPVRGDRTLLTEAVVNVVDNAVKWSPPGGRLSIASGKTAAEAFLAVADAGPGVDSQFREHLFDRFSRHPATAYKGSGLGLSIVSEVMRLHQGRIQVEDAPDGGACFRFTFPVTEHRRAGEPADYAGWRFHEKADMGSQSQS